MGLRFSLFCEFDGFSVGGCFLWVACLWRFLVRCIQACGFLVVSTHSTERCFHLYSKWLTGWAGSEGFSQEKRDGL